MTILILDLGSSSIRALLFDDQAALLAQADRRSHFITDPPGAAIFDPEELQTNVEACIDEILQHPQANSVRAVGMDTFVGNVLGVDQAGNAITPIYTYADTRSAEDVAELGKQLDLEDSHQRTGCLLHTAYLPSRLRWLRRTEPELFASVVQWIDVGTHLYRRWFGEASCSYSVASWSGLLNRETLDWDEQWLQLLDLPKSALPNLTDYTETRSGLLPEYAGRWRALRDVPFLLAVGDGAAANVGSGCVAQGQIALTLGTTAALRTVSTDKLPTIPRGLWSYRIDKPHHLIGGATSEGGNIFEWARETLALPDDTEEVLAQRSADEHGLTFLPLLAGERSPGWTVHATGTIHGLRMATTPLDILQAALESVALRLAIIAEQMIAEGKPGGDQAVVASGGAIESSRAWTQMIANALNRPLQLAGESEITARGAAILVLAALDKRELSDYPLRIAETIDPQSDAVEALRAARERQEALYNKLYGKD